MDTSLNDEKDKARIVGAIEIQVALPLYCNTKINSEEDELRNNASDFSTNERSVIVIEESRM